MLSRRELHLELLDERSDVLVGDNLALPFLDAEHGLVHLELEIVLDLNLAAEAPVVFLLLAREVNSLGGKDLTAALEDLALALSARAFAAASGRQVHTGFAE